MAARSSTYDYMNDSHQSYKCTIEGWRGDRRSARLIFRKVVNGTPVDSPGMEPKSVPTCITLNTLSKCKDLAIDICSGNDLVSICATQDTLFAFVDRIPEAHCLRSLTVRITVVLPNENVERPWIVSDVWPSSFLQLPTILENKMIQPGDLSRMHMIAFLTDPLRKIRQLGGGGKIKCVGLDFSGRTGTVWKEILIVVKDLVCGESDLKDYETFRRYFDGIRHLIKSIQQAIKIVNKLQENAMPDGLAPESPESLPATPATGEAREIIDLTIDDLPISIGLTDLRAATKALAMARIRGSFKDLRAGHRELLEMADKIVVAASRLPTNERFASVLGRLYQNKDYAVSIFPKKADVSHYGYNESDMKLVEYRSDPEGYVERKAKLRSKRKKARVQDA